MASGIFVEFDASQHAVLDRFARLGSHPSLATRKGANCREESCFTHDAEFLIVDLTFHGQWHICQFRCQPSCSGKFAWLGSHPRLATRKDATVEVVLATCHKCSSKACLLSVPFGPRSLQQMQLRKDTTSGQLSASRV